MIGMPCCCASTIPAASVNPICARPVATRVVSDTWGPPDCKVTSRPAFAYRPSSWAAKKPPPSGSAYQGSSMVNFSAPAGAEEDADEPAAGLPGELEHAASSSTPPARAAAASAVLVRLPESVGNMRPLLGQLGWVLR